MLFQFAVKRVKLQKQELLAVLRNAAGIFRKQAHTHVNRGQRPSGLVARGSVL